MAAAGTRHAARIYALKVLYAADVSGNNASELVGQLADAFELALDRDMIEFARFLVAEAHAKAREIDEQIQAASKNWRLDRMSRVDRNILRLATAELSSKSRTPVEVIINEAVELGKSFGAKESSSFINGILDRIAATIEIVQSAS